VPGRSGNAGRADVTAHPPGSLEPTDLRAAVRADTGELLDDLRRFMDRRLKELSVEVHGTVQMLDFSEANLTAKLGSIHEQIGSLIAVPAMATRNSGLELEAVVLATEEAANRIMEAAEAIGDWLNGGARDAESFDEVSARVNAIFEACSFQDLTGQRIRRAIGHLQKVETLLERMMPGDPGPSSCDAPEPADHMPACSGSDLPQDEIDRLLS
jgi:chemotaxis protein CheZ